MNGTSASDTEHGKVSPMTAGAASSPPASPMSPADRRAQRWARQRDVVLTVIGWLFIIYVIIWGASHIIRSLLVLLLAILLAYALAPGVTLLRRVMPRWLAILVVYLVAVSLLGGLIYLIVDTLIAQMMQLAHALTQAGRGAPGGMLGSLLATLHHFGVSDAQIAAARDQLLGQAGRLTNDVIPLLRGVFDAVLDAILVIVLSVYLIIDGERLVRWIQTNAPLNFRSRVRFSLTTLERVVGGYIRGQTLLGVIVGVLVGGGMFLFQIPYALLLGVLAFVFEYIPIIGVFISGALCVVLALISHGILWAVLVLLYFVLVHIIEGDVVGPRIVGRAVGVHPAVSIFALLAGAELFGVWGALLASPIAGVLQVVIATIFREWRLAHPREYPEEFGPVIVPVTTAQAEAQAASGSSPDVAPTAVATPPAPGDTTAESPPDTQDDGSAHASVHGARSPDSFDTPDTQGTATSTDMSR